MIALVDMNAFFASIEQLDRPTWRGRAIGITNGERGTCVITSSYEARAYGIKTGMRVREAKQLCPGFIQVPARPLRYAAVATMIMEALKDISPDIEVFSVDEAFLDLTRCQSLYGSDAWAIGRMIKEKVFSATGLLCSVGVSGDKTTAKWAAKLDKPNGLFVASPWVSESLLADVPVTDLCGVNTGIGRFLAERGVTLCGDMKRLPISALGQRFGNPGRRIWLMAQARDPEPVRQTVAEPKTMGHGKVIPPDTQSYEVLRTFYLHMAEKVGRRLRKNDYQAQLFSVGLRTAVCWQGYKTRTVAPTDDGQAIFELCRFFLDTLWDGVGGFQVQVNALDPKPKSQQTDLFYQPCDAQARINQAMDAISSKYGEWALFRAPLINRSDMPNVIAPAWKPFGHRESIEY